MTPAGPSRRRLCLSQDISLPCPLPRVTAPSPASSCKRKRAAQISALYVRDGDLTNNVVPCELPAGWLRRRTVQNLYALHNSIAEREETAAKAAGSSIAAVARRAQRSQAMIAAAETSVGQLVQELVGADLVVPVVLRTADRYAVEHGLDVAVAAALLARKLALPQDDLRSLVAGCLMIDIGNTVLRPELLTQPGPCSPAERELLQAHPEAGFVIVRALQWGGILAQHVVYQHHERQDGAGYPRRLRGLNRIYRSRAEQLDGRLITQIAAIAAIADAFAAMRTDRPHRPACTQEQTAAALREMKGVALNAQMVEVFLGLIPDFPLGATVTLWGGGFRGQQGVVVEYDEANPRRPVVCLRRGDQPQSLRLLRTANRPEVEITLVASPPSTAGGG